MKFAIIGGNTRWSKILIKNFKKFGHILLFTSSNFLKKRNNYINFKNIPTKDINFIILASNPLKNLEAFKYFIKKKIPLFLEKPISNSYKNFLNIKKFGKKNSYFVHYQHIYSEPIYYLKKCLKKEKLISLNIDFGKNGPMKNINSSYEWLPHPLSIFFYLTNKNLNIYPKYSKYLNKKKTNIHINGNIKNEFFLNIKSGNNFSRRKYFIEINTNKKIYRYNATSPKKMIIITLNNNQKKIIKFKSFPLESSIRNFNNIINNNEKKILILKQNKKITDKIMNYFNKFNL